MSDPAAPPLAGTRVEAAVAHQGVGAARVATPVRGAAPAHRRTGRDRRGRLLVRGVVAVLVVLLLLASLLAAHLYRTTVAWQQRSAEYLKVSQQLGEDLAGSRAELAGARGELDAVRAQLATAQQRIVELADEKARLGDDREVQRQLADYQERVSDAAGRVALALDQCVQGQNQLIGYMEDAAQYDPVELDRYASDVQSLCQTATEANTALQRELAG